MILFPFWFFWFSVALHHDPPECVTSSVGDDAYIISSRDSGPCISTMTCCSGDRMVFFWLFRKATWWGFIRVNIFCYFHNRQCGYTWSFRIFTMRYHLCCNFVVLAQLMTRAHSPLMELHAFWCSWGWASCDCVCFTFPMLHVVMSYKQKVNYWVLVDVFLASW